MLAPGRSLAFVTLPQGMDPDDLVRQRGARAFEALLDEAEPLVTRLWKHELAAETLDTPEQRAGLRPRLTARAATVANRNVRHENLSDFRTPFDDHFTPPRLTSGNNRTFAHSPRTHSHRVSPHPPDKP